MGIRLTIRLGHALDLILLLYGIAVRRPASCVDDLIREALGDGLHVSESGLTSTHGHEVEGVVHSSEGRDVDGLSLHCTCATHTSRVLSRSAVDDCIYEELHGVLVGEDVDQLEGVSNDAAGHQLLAVVAAEAHHRAGKTLNDGALQGDYARLTAVMSSTWAFLKHFR